MNIKKVPLLISGIAIYAGAGTAMHASFRELEGIHSGDIIIYSLCRLAGLAYNSSEDWKDIARTEGMIGLSSFVLSSVWDLATRRPSVMMFVSLLVKNIITMGVNIPLDKGEFEIYNKINGVKQVN